MPGHAVDLVVGGHHRGDGGFVYGRIEGHEELAAQVAFGDVDGAAVGARLGLAVRGEVFGRRQHVIGADRARVALQARDRGHAHARDQVRVLSVHLVHSAPARLARQIEVGAEDPGRAARARLARDDGEDLFDQGRIEGGAERQRDREDGRALLHEAVHALVEEERRDVLPAARDHAFGQRVHEARRRGRVAVEADALEAARACWRRGAQSLGRLLRRPVPDVHERCDLLFEGHRREQGARALARRTERRRAGLDRDRRLRARSGRAFGALDRCRRPARQGRDRERNRQAEDVKK